MRTYQDYQREIDTIEAEAKRITARPVTQDQKLELVKMQGRLEELRKEQAERHDEEVRGMREVVATATPRFVSGGDSIPVSAEIEDLRAYVRSGEVRAALTTGGSAGYTLPNPVVDEIINLAKDADPILRGAKVYMIDGGASSIEVPVQSADGAVSWAAEDGARAETTSPTFALHTINCYEIFALWHATQLVIDSQPRLEQWIIEEIGRTLLQAAGVKFAVGDGSSAILGMFAYTSSGYTTRLSGAANTLQASAFPSAFTDLPAVYHPNAAWVMAPATLATCCSFDDPNTSATTPLVKFDTGQPMIMGKPVLLCDNAPAVGDGAYPVFFGDISRAYGVAIHRNVTVLRDPYSAKPYVAYYGTLRIGGYPLDPKAGVLVKSDDS